jgi:hyperosmotically inducible periplasmic protein
VLCSAPIPPQDSSDNSAGLSEKAPTDGSTSIRDAVKDTDITAKVKYALYQHEGMKGSDIHVTTDNGVVMLFGTVQGHHQAMVAARIARTTIGVREVVSELKELTKVTANN